MLQTNAVTNSADQNVTSILASNAMRSSQVMSDDIFPAEPSANDEINISSEMMGEDFVATIKDSSAYSRLSCAIIFQALNDYFYIIAPPELLEKKTKKKAVSKSNVKRTGKRKNTANLLTYQRTIDGNDAKNWIYNLKSTAVYSLTQCCAAINMHLEYCGHIDENVVDKDIIKPSHIHSFIADRERFLRVMSVAAHLGATNEFLFDNLMFNSDLTYNSSVDYSVISDS